MMDIGALWQRWLDVLVATYVTQREAWRSRRAVIVSYSDDQVVIRKMEADVERMAEPGQSIRQDGSPVAVIGAGERVSAAVARMARGGFAILELPDEHVVVRRIAVPAQAREFVGGIVANQIERLSPWRADQAVYGHAVAADAGAKDPAMLDVRVLIAS